MLRAKSLTRGAERIFHKFKASFKRVMWFNWKTLLLAIHNIRFCGVVMEHYGANFFCSDLPADMSLTNGS